MAWIEFLLRLRTTNMTIGKMLKFSRLRGAGDATVPDRRQMLEEHLTEVLSEIEAIRQSADALQAKIEYYRGLEQSLASNSNSDEGYADEQRNPLRMQASKVTGDRR
ncbi:hypothetical protein [Klebsiella sp. WOUb02]